MNLASLPLIGFQHPQVAKDPFEKVGDICLFLPRKAFGHTYTILDGSVSSVQEHIIMRIAAAALFILCAVLTLPLALVGVWAEMHSGTYLASLATYELLSPSLPHYSTEKARAVFDNGLRHLSPREFSQALFKTKHLLTAAHWTTLVQALEGQQRHIEAIAQIDREEGKLVHSTFILHSSLPQFTLFMRAFHTSEDNAGLEFALVHLLEFFHDHRNPIEKGDLYADKLRHLSQVWGEKSFAAAIDESKLHRKESERLVQLVRLHDIFPTGPIRHKMATLLAVRFSEKPPSSTEGGSFFGYLVNNFSAADCAVFVVSQFSTLHWSIWIAKELAKVLINQPQDKTAYIQSLLIEISKQKAGSLLITACKKYSGF